MCLALMLEQHVSDEMSLAAAAVGGQDVILRATREVFEGLVYASLGVLAGVSH